MPSKFAPHHIQDFSFNRAQSARRKIAICRLKLVFLLCLHQSNSCKYRNSSFRNSLLTSATLIGLNLLLCNYMYITICIGTITICIIHYNYMWFTLPAPQISQLYNITIYYITIIPSANYILYNYNPIRLRTQIRVTDWLWADIRLSLVPLRNVYLNRRDYPSGPYKTGPREKHITYHSP